MWQAIRENPRAVTYAVLMHVVLLLLLVISLDWTPKAIKPGTHKPIQAELVDRSQLKAVEEKKQAEQRRIAEEQQAQGFKQETQQKAEAERKQQGGAGRETEGRSRAGLPNKRRRPSANSKAEQAAKQKAEAERKRKDEAGGKTEGRGRSASARQNRRQRKRRGRGTAQRNRPQRRRRQPRRRVSVKRSRHCRHNWQKSRRRHAPSMPCRGIFRKYRTRYSVTGCARVAAPAGLSCLIRVKLIPGGEVVDAKVVRSSGDPLFDRSVETAVLKASPLPMPADVAMFKYFREINFNFNPDT